MLFCSSFIFDSLKRNRQIAKWLMFTKTIWINFFCFLLGKRPTGIFRFWPTVRGGPKCKTKKKKARDLCARSSLLLMISSRRSLLQRTATPAATSTACKQDLSVYYVAPGFKPTSFPSERPAINVWPTSTLESDNEQLILPDFSWFFAIIHYLASQQQQQQQGHRISSHRSPPQQQQQKNYNDLWQAISVSAWPSVNCS